MRREKISEAVGEIAPGFIDEAMEYKAKPAARGAWKKWAAAACLALVLAMGIPFAKGLFASSGDKQGVNAVMLIEYDGAYLEVIKDPAAAEKHGLPKKITEDIIGSHVAYLRKEFPGEEYSNYIVSAGETDIELLEYSPAPCKAVRILRDGEKYYYALFCNYLVGTDNSLPMGAAFEVFGVSDAADIVSITPVKSESFLRPRGEAVTENAAIAEFYGEASKLPAFCFEDFHGLVFAAELEEASGTGRDIGQEPYNRLANDRRDILLETKGGLRFCLEYYPAYGWLYAPETMSYYRISPGLSEWLADYTE